MLALKYLNDTEIYEVGFDKADHVVTIKGNIPAKTDGFTLSRIGYEDEWDYSQFTTIYRELEDGVQFSDDGSIYEPPKKNVVVSAVWNDQDDTKGVRPNNIHVLVEVNGENYETITLNEENEWKKVYENVPETDEYKVIAPDVIDYEKNVSGTTITYYTEVPQPYEPTVEELSEAIAEVYEMVAQNASDIVDTQEAVAEIYEMIGE